MKRYLLALMGLFFLGSALAESIPATPVGAKYKSRLSGVSDPLRNNVLCKPPAGAIWATTDACPAGTTAQPGGTVDCALCRDAATNQPTVKDIIDFTPAHQECPSGQGYTLSGSTCTRPDCAAGETRNAQGVCEAPCKSGQTRVNGVCQCDNGAQTGTDGTCCPVAGSGGGAPMQWCYVDTMAATSCDSAGTNGCKVRCNNVTFQKGTGNMVQIFPKQALGQNCSYTGTKATNQGGGPLNNDELGEVSKATTDPAKAKTPEGCLAAGMGYVQTAGGTTCVGGGDTGVKKTSTENKSSTNNGQTTTDSKTSETTQGPNGETTTKETTTTTNPDGSTKTTTKTTTRNPDGTVTTETTETSKDANGNQTGNKNDKANQTQSSFCKENPDSDICKGQTDQCKDHPDRLGCMDSGEAIEQPDLASSEKGISAITPINVSSNASCPPDLPLPKGMTFSFQPFCDYASAFRPIVLALAWITAGFLAFGYRGNNA